MIRIRLMLAILLVCLLVAPLTAQAQRPDAPQYAKRGPFPVGTRELTISDAVPPLTVTIWYPALNPDNLPEAATYTYGLFSGQGRALRDATPDTAKGPYPLVVFSHGLGGVRLQLLAYTEHLASHGFVVMAADHPGSAFSDLLTGGAGILESFGRRPLEVLEQIDYAEKLGTPGSDWAGVIDTNMVAVSGHSFGGYTTLAAAGARLDTAAIKADCAKNPNQMGSCATLEQIETVAKARGLSEIPTGLWPATTDPRIKAAVALAPSSGPTFGEQGAAALSIPLMIIVGSKDQATPPESNAFPVYESASSQQKALVVLENAGHYIFVDKCQPLLITLGRFEQCSDLVWDMDRAHDLTNHMATAFLLSVLKGDTEAEKALDPEAVKFAGVRYEQK